MHTPTKSHSWYQCSQSRNIIAALQPVQQYRCSIASNRVIPMQHCRQSCNTNAALHAIVQSPLELQKIYSKTHIFTPIAALLAIMQSQCNQPCTPSVSVYALMQSQCNQPCTPSVSVYALTHSQCNQPCTPPVLYCFNRVFQCMHSHTPNASIPALSKKISVYYRLWNVPLQVIVFLFAHHHR